MLHTLQKFEIYQGVGLYVGIKERMWTFDVDYVTRNNSRIHAWCCELLCVTTNYPRVCSLQREVVVEFNNVSTMIRQAKSPCVAESFMSVVTGYYNFRSRKFLQ